MSRLPVRTARRPGQCLGDWLEHLAIDNGLAPAALAALLRADGGHTRFLTIRPEATTQRTISMLTGQPGSAVHDATMSRYDGTALDLAGLDPARWSSWRSVAARGWFRPTGTAACVSCLAAEDYWRLAWRLPTVTVCTRHACYLVEECPGCGRRFGDHPRSPLRYGTGSRCLNPLGGRTWCDVDVAQLSREQAPAEELARQRRHDTALDRQPVSVLGTLVPAGAYLADVRHLAVLLLHLATRSATDERVGWAGAARDDAVARGRARWHLSPPADPRVRSAVLTTADQMVTAPDLVTGAALLAPWVEAAPSGTESRLGWLADRTTITPTLTRMVMAALAPHQRVSAHLSRTSTQLKTSHIPQAIPEPLYRRHAARLFTTTRGETNRLYLSLCIARQTGPATWALAAHALGVDPVAGTRTARSVSARNRIKPNDLLAALEAISRELDAHYRECEHQVRRFTRWQAWFEDWASEHRPGTRPSSYPYAITWLWCHHAGGLLATSPAWPVPPGRSVRAGYRQFADSLGHAAGNALAAVPQREGAYP